MINGRLITDQEYRTLPEQVGRPHNGEVLAVHAGFGAVRRDARQVTNQILRRAIMRRRKLLYDVTNPRQSDVLIF